MQKIISSFTILFLLSNVSFSQPRQGTVEMDAIAFVRDSGKIQVELYYSIVQGALQFEQKGNSWVAMLDARAEIWHDGHVITGEDIKKEKVFKGSKSSLDSAKSSLLLDGTVLTGNIQSNDEAVLIFRSKNEKRVQVSDTIRRNFFAPVIQKEKFFLSGIELATSLTQTSDSKNPFEKVGFIITPNPSKLFGVSNSKLNYYTELYIPSEAVSASGSCTIVTRVLDGQKHEMFSNSHMQILAAKTVPLVGSIDVDGLPTDSYILEIVVKSGEKIEATMQKVFFFDSGMKMSEEHPDVSSEALDEETIYTVSDLSRIAELELQEKGDQAMYLSTNDQAKAWKKLKNKLETDEENEQSAASDMKSNVTKQKEDDIQAQRKFLFYFWRMKDKEENSSSPLLAYRVYYRHVDEVNKKFTYQKTPGWETDFGRIYLKFGAPDERNVTSVLHSVDAKPYIIWVYVDKTIRLMNGTHAEFDFVDKQGGGKFILVHSNVQGETYEPDWYSQEAARTH
jgi:GWxTD domain-containing protein